MLQIPILRRLREYVRQNCELKIRPKHYKPPKTWGLNTTPRTPRLVVSLTSFPARIGTAHNTIHSLLRQSCKPDVLVLWLAREQFPGGEKELPDNLLKLKEFGLSICWCEDVRSYKKLIPSLQEFPDAVIITADDDVFYPKRWLQSFYSAYLAHPDRIHAGHIHHITLSDADLVNPFKEWQWHVRCSKPSLLHSFIGLHGVLYPPDSLHPDVFKSGIFMQLAPTADDLFFWAMAVLKGTRVQTLQHHRQQVIGFPTSHETALWHENWQAGGNERALCNILAHYPQLHGILHAEGAANPCMDLPSHPPHPPGCQ